MCIRDSHKDDAGAGGGGKKERGDDSHPEADHRKHRRPQRHADKAAADPHGGKPVSYTHLDVYKRQALVLYWPVAFDSLGVYLFLLVAAPVLLLSLIHI